MSKLSSPYQSSVYLDTITYVFKKNVQKLAKYMTKKQIPFRTRFARAKREGKWFIFRALPEK